MCIYIYIYREREIDVYIYIYIHTHTYTHWTSSAHGLGIWISKGLTQADPELSGVEFLAP